MKFDQLLTRCLALLVLTFAAHADMRYLPENHPVNGGLAIIPIDIKQKPEAQYDGRPVLVVKSPKANQWLLIVAIPLDKSYPIQEIDILKPVKAKVPFHISDKFYRTQSLSIQNVRKVDPLPEDEGRLKEEEKKLATIYSQSSPADPFAGQWVAPSTGPISSLFGLKRVYNNKPRAPHSGLDVAAPAGSPVKAAAAGQVVEAGDYFYTGNTVIVDHGQGVFSLYGHLDKMLVKPGQPVKAGETVGTIGMTGRVTGPHLHWTMIVNQTLVDPLLFVPVRKIAIIPPTPAKKP